MPGSHDTSETDNYFLGGGQSFRRPAKTVTKDSEGLVENWLRNGYLQFSLDCEIQQAARRSAEHERAHINIRVKSCPQH